MSDDLLITFASWEDRFWLGSSRNLENIGVRKVLVLYFDSYSDRTKKNRYAVEKSLHGEKY